MSIDYIYCLDVISVGVIPMSESVKSPELYREQITTFVTDIFEKGNLDKLADVMAADHQYPMTKHEELQGIEGTKDMISRWRTGFPDLKHDIKEIAVDGDLAFVYVTFSGTHDGDLVLKSDDGETYEIPATGNHTEYDLMVMVRFDDDAKMKETRVLSDSIEMLQDLNLMPDTDELLA